MKFGVALPNFGKYASVETIAKMACEAEQLGYDSVWVSDHITVPTYHGGFGQVFYEPLATLSYVAACTKRVLLGTSAIVLPYRNPIVTAKALSTIDVLSGGRLIVGVAAGWLEAEFLALGVPFHERGPLTDEGIEVMRAVFESSEPTFYGSRYRLEDMVFLPLPVQRPRPPIIVAGVSHAAISRAARLGDGWHPVGLTPEELGQKVRVLHEEIAKRGRGGFGVYLRKNLQIGVVEEREAEPLRGSPDKVREGIGRYIEAGVTHFVFQVLSGTFEGVLETMRVFMDEIKPGL
ncbi:MAG: LLM class F420-dependent oxidoreductase [Candidatus Methanosuratincola sp.]